ncbi:hypothetical protein GJ744_006659 [Endocarpon pusillum]|uniref:Uncharacterized protein n=1 Tax=Endocarpon pusillum TaxID=364733 RepID=A0A8H7ASK1_9EURO|nr:hypothetical protein GJ744_006659 [Endocarpon pusillum]
MSPQAQVIARRSLLSVNERLINEYLKVVKKTTKDMIISQQRPALTQGRIPTTDTHRGGSAGGNVTGSGGVVAVDGATGVGAWSTSLPAANSISVNGISNNNRD